MVWVIGLTNQLAESAVKNNFCQGNFFAGGCIRISKKKRCFDNTAGDCGNKQ